MKSPRRLKIGERKAEENLDVVGRGRSNLLKFMISRQIAMRSDPQMKGGWNYEERDELSEVGGVGLGMCPKAEAHRDE